MSNVTFVMLKPDTVRRNLIYPVMHYFEQAGIYAKCFDIQLVDPSRIKEHYAEHIQKNGDWFERRVMGFFENHYVVPVILTGSGDLIARVREIVGVTEPLKAHKGTIRGDLGLDDSYEKAGSEDRLVQNLIHASDCSEAARREAKIWLPDYPFEG